MVVNDLLKAVYLLADSVKEYGDSVVDISESKSTPYTTAAAAG